MVKAPHLRPGWIKTQLGEICTFASGTGFREAYQGKRSGEYPFIKVSDLSLDGNEKSITTSNNWIDDAARKQLKATIHPKDSIVFAKVGAALKLNKRRLLTRPTAIDNNMMAAVPNRTQIVPEYLYYFLCTKDFARLCQDGAVPSVNQAHLSEIPINLPSLDEQHRIIERVRSWDNAIQKLDQLICAKERKYAAFSVALLKGHIRLTDDNSEWQNVQFTDVTRELMNCNAGRLGSEVVMGVNKIHGMVPMKEHVRAEDLSRYKVVPPCSFAYNPMRLNVGSLAMNTSEREVLVSPDYVSFNVRQDRLDCRFFDHLRRSSIWSNFVATAGSGSVRVRIYYEHLSGLSFHLPSAHIQLRIADVIDAAKREIEILKEQAELFDRQKRGLMQKLLTGVWRVPMHDANLRTAAAQIAEEALR